MESVAPGHEEEKQMVSLTNIMQLITWLGHLSIVELEELVMHSVKTHQPAQQYFGMRQQTQHQSRILQFPKLPQPQKHLVMIVGFLSHGHYQSYSWFSYVVQAQLFWVETLQG